MDELPPTAIEALTESFGLNNAQLQGRDDAMIKLLGQADPSEIRGSEAVQCASKPSQSSTWSRRPACNP
ncbi:hypothetical protein E2562_026945 [Oryza meyeriana var. granulata]|uniref:Uncharacterized protein n=1 Tax=Oryza meyeriana var. granulata TaxID=110450 RepID=A0A6G1BP19_9ORYZ|nr:hypothetical protein E2562_026945 [Oryza meyeriana var. granulata]